MLKLYFYGSLLLCLPWLFIFFFRKDLRENLLFSSLVLMPFGITEYVFIPDYWNPPTIFEALKPFSVEAFIFCFFAGGVVAAAYKAVFGIRLKKCYDVNIYRRIFYVLAFIFIFNFTGMFGYRIISAAVFGFFGGIAVIFIVRPDLKKHHLINSFFCSFFYIVLFFLFSFIDSSFFYIWNVDFRLLGFPIPEILWIFSFTAFWGFFYEYWFGYRLVMKKGSIFSCIR